MKNNRRLRILAVSKNDELAKRIRHLFPMEKARVDCDPRLDRVPETIATTYYDVLLITGAAFRAASNDGIDLLETIRRGSPGTQILFLAESRDLRTAVSALKAGTFHYIKLPTGDDELRMVIEAAFENRPLTGAVAGRGMRPPVESFEQMCGRSLCMQELYRQIRQAASTDMPILVQGETGTGKELAARAIHAHSERKDGPFVPVNLGAVPTELVASELFGHEKGAFTGAVAKSKGKFEQALDGTLFLDEIGTIDPKMQVSLLRVIEQKKVYRLGARRAITTNARLIAASNEELEDRMRNGDFREDLYYRLDVFRIMMPPLRDRGGDLSLLINMFVNQYNRELGKQILGVSPEFMHTLDSYPWPGNVRELKNVIQRAVLVCEGEVLLVEHLPARFRKEPAVHPRVTFEVGTPLDKVEREMILRTLAAARNNRTETAELLGISRRSLYNRLRKHGIE